MKKRLLTALLLPILLIASLSSCKKSPEDIKIGVSFGVGAAVRWQQEEIYMKERAAELGVNIETRLNKTDEPKTQTEDCIEMIDSGIDVLILTPRDVTKVTDIMAYAREKKVPVISYARIAQGEAIDLFVGYDSSRMGQKLGQHLSETVFEGDYIILSGDSGDSNATLLYEGSMRYIDPIKDKINIILDAAVPNWSPEEAEKMVIDAITKNDGNIDAILAPNDKIAGACAEALKKLNITKEVIITGMDAELDAVKRIANDEQSCTIYMDLKELAHTAVNEAVHLANNEKVNTNAEFDNQGEVPAPANLITGQLVVKNNIDKLLIDSGYFTKEEIYGE